MRMSLIESDLKARIEEEIREIAERRASEIIEDHLSKTAESPGLNAAPMRAIAPTMMEEEIIEAVKATPVRSLPPVADVRETQPRYSSPPTALYSSPPGAIYSSAPYSAPPPPYSAPPPRSSYGPPSSHPSFGPPSSHPSMHPSMRPVSMHPASMHPASGSAPISLFPHSTPNYVVWPEAPEATLKGAMEAAAPRRVNALLMAVAALALGLSGAAFAASTGHLGNATASAAPLTRPLVQQTQYETMNGSAPQAEDPSFAASPAPTLRANTNAPAGNDAPRWSRRYKGSDGQLANAPKAAAQPVAEKAATKDVKPADAPPAQPVAAPEPPPAQPAPSMDQASKTAAMLREQLNSSVK